MIIIYRSGDWFPVNCSAFLLTSNHVPKFCHNFIHLWKVSGYEKSLSILVAHYRLCPQILLNIIHHTRINRKTYCKIILPGCKISCQKSCNLHRMYLSCLIYILYNNIYIIIFDYLQQQWLIVYDISDRAVCHIRLYLRYRIQLGNGRYRGLYTYFVI